MDKKNFPNINSIDRATLVVARSIKHLRYSNASKTFYEDHTTFNETKTTRAPRKPSPTPLVSEKTFTGIQSDSSMETGQNPIHYKHSIEETGSLFLHKSGRTTSSEDILHSNTETDSENQCSANLKLQWKKNVTCLTRIYLDKAALRWAL